jgi:hypothetical protein
MGRCGVALVLGVVVLVGVSGCKDWVDINDRDIEQIGKTLDANVGTLTRSIDGLEETAKTLTVGLQQSLAITILNLRGLAEQLQASIRSMMVGVTNFQETMTADLTAGIAGISETVDRLRSGLATDAANAIQRISLELEEQRVALLRQTHRVVQATIRPTIERLSREGDYFVGKVTLQANVITIRLISGILAMIALIGLLVALVKLKTPARRWPAVGVLSLVLLGSGLSATAFASMIASLGAPAYRIPAGSKVCAEMGEAHRRFKTLTLAEAKLVAVRLKDLAVECQVVAPAAELADQADEAFGDASRALGDVVKCVTHADCSSQGKRCDATTGECLDPTVYCAVQTDCLEGHQCVNRRCVAIDQSAGTCATPNDCRPEQSCNKGTGRCEVTASIAPTPCEVEGRFGPCRTGATSSVERWVACTQTTFAVPEVCDGLDNNCDNTIDEGIQRAERCIASGAAGECAAQGNWTCGGTAGWQCVAAGPQAETCDGKDNDCDGEADEGVPAGASCQKGAGQCARTATLRCVGGLMDCVPGTPSPEACDGLDNDCDGLEDPMGTCGEVVIRQQGDADNGREMTWSPNLPTDLIDGVREHGGPCGEDEHGRPYYRTRAAVSAASPHGAICELAGPYGGFLTEDPRDCRIRVHYKTVRMGSNVWCSGTWWGGPRRQIPALRTSVQGSSGPCSGRWASGMNGEAGGCGAIMSAGTRAERWASRSNSTMSWAQ